MGQVSVAATLQHMPPAIRWRWLSGCAAKPGTDSHRQGERITQTDYLPVWQAMRDFTEARQPGTPDELWLTEHAPIYTLGQTGRYEHILENGSITVVTTDRGGQATYHGPGQVVAYCLIDLQRRGMFVKNYVTRLESALMDTLTQLGMVNACFQPGAPGVYVAQPDGALAKVAALGIKVRRGCTYHGVALNVAMDLNPFLGINPCGHAGLRVVDLASCGIRVSVQAAGEILAACLCRHLGHP